MECDLSESQAPDPRTFRESMFEATGLWTADTGASVMHSFEHLQLVLKSQLNSRGRSDRWKTGFDEVESLKKHA